MRYFYYGAENDTMENNRRISSPMGDSFRRELVEEEDTVYEIDRACVECQKRIRERKRRLE
jgi:hypothetical protein